MREPTGLEGFLAHWRRVLQTAVCWLFGHKINTASWCRKPFSVATHSRTHTCDRCGLEWVEEGFFDALNPAHEKMFSKK